MARHLYSAQNTGKRRVGSERQVFMPILCIRHVVSVGNQFDNTLKALDMRINRVSGVNIAQRSSQR